MALAALPPSQIKCDDCKTSDKLFCIPLQNSRNSSYFHICMISFFHLLFIFVVRFDRLLSFSFFKLIFSNSFNMLLRLHSRAEKPWVFLVCKVGGKFWEAKKKFSIVVCMLEF